MGLFNQKYIDSQDSWCNRTSAQFEEYASSHKGSTSLRTPAFIYRIPKIIQQWDELSGIWHKTSHGIMRCQPETSWKVGGIPDLLSGPRLWFLQRVPFSKVGNPRALCSHVTPPPLRLSISFLLQLRGFCHRSPSTQRMISPIKKKKNSAE